MLMCVHAQRCVTLMLDTGGQNIQKAQPEPCSSDTTEVYHISADLTHAAGELLLASGAETMTFTNLPLRKLQRKINSRKTLGLFLFHPDILFCLSQHADAVKQVTKILGFRGLDHLPPSLPRRQSPVLPPPSHTLSHCILAIFKTLKMKRNNIFGSFLSP